MERSRLEQLKIQLAKDALIENDGIAYLAAEWMGITSRSFRMLMNKYTEIRVYMCDSSIRKSIGLKAVASNRKRLSKFYREE